MSISEHKVTSNKKRKIVLIIYILISIVLHSLLADSSFVSDNIQRIAHFLGFVLGAVIRWTFLIAFFLMNEELVSKYKTGKEKELDLLLFF